MRRSARQKPGKSGKGVLGDARGPVRISFVAHDIVDEDKNAAPVAMFGIVWQDAFQRLSGKLDQSANSTHRLCASS